LYTYGHQGVVGREQRNIISFALVEVLWRRQQSLPCRFQIQKETSFSGTRIAGFLNPSNSGVGCGEELTQLKYYDDEDVRVGNRHERRYCTCTCRTAK
jgi:hypothetical protein